MEHRHKAVDTLIGSCYLPDLVNGPIGKMHSPKQLGLRRGNDLVGVTERRERVHPDGVRHRVADAQRRRDDRRAQHQTHRDEDALREPSRHIADPQLDEDRTRPGIVSDNDGTDNQDAEQSNCEPERWYAEKLLHE